MARMEFLKLVRKRSFLSEVIYAALNVGLAVAILLTVRYTESIWFALGLVALSKWRVLAVRPRYWWANIRSNSVDFIVSVSFVIHMRTISESITNESQSLALAIGFTACYIAWLLWVKPRSKRSFVVAQAGIAIFMGSDALFTVGYNWPASLIVIGMWLIGITAARHVLSTYDDEMHNTFLSVVWGLVFAQIGWVAYHWVIAYPLPVFSSLMIPQVSIIATLLSFVAYKAYDSFFHHSKIRAVDVLMPLLFSAAIAVVLLILFNRVGTAI